MISFYRNAMETARPDHRARRALVWECVALHQLVVLIVRRSAHVFTASIGGSGCFCRGGARP